MNPKFQAAVQQKDEVTYVKISGVIDEDNDLGPLAERLSTSTAVIDVSEIERINSCGVRDWVNWLGRLEKLGVRKAVLVQCSPAIVAQINLVSNFTGSGQVRSFYAPYFCPACEREKALLIETRDMAGKAPFKAPVCRCDECDGVMDFDDMEESYFAFLANSKKVVTDAAVESAVNEFAPTTPGEQKLRLRATLPPVGGTATGQSGIPESSMPSLQAISRGNITFPGGKLPNGAKPDESVGRFTGGTGQHSIAPWILVGVLVAAAIALLAYVFLSGPSTGAAARPPATPTAQP